MLRILSPGDHLYRLEHADSPGDHLYRLGTCWLPPGNHLYRLGHAESTLSGRSFI